MELVCLVTSKLAFEKYSLRALRQVEVIEKVMKQWVDNIKKIIGLAIIYFGIT